MNGEFFDENINLMQTDFENFQIEILEQDVTEGVNGRAIQNQNSTQLKSLRLPSVTLSLLISSNLLFLFISII